MQYNVTLEMKVSSTT